MSKKITITWKNFNGKLEWAPLRNDIWTSIRYFDAMRTEIEQSDENVTISICHDDFYYNEVIKFFLHWCDDIENRNLHATHLTTPQYFNMMHLCSYLQEEHKLAVLMPCRIPEDTEECMNVINNVSTDVFWSILENYCDICRCKASYYSNPVKLWFCLTVRPKFAEFSWSTEEKRKHILDYIQYPTKSRSRLIKLSYKEVLIDLKDLDCVKDIGFEVKPDTVLDKLKIDQTEKSDRNYALEQRKRLKILQIQTMNALNIYNRARTSSQCDGDLKAYQNRYLKFKQELELFEKTIQ